MGGGRRGRVLAACLATVVAAGAGCGGDDDREGSRPAARARTTTTVDPAARARLMALGRRVFVEHCDFCHRLDGRRPPRNPPPDAYGPSFDHVRPTETHVASVVTNGTTAMGSFRDLLPARAIRAVALYVSTVAGRDVVERDTSPATMRTGEQVFERHCRSCHTLADRRRTDDPRWPATDFNAVKPSAAFVRSLLTGDGNAFLTEFMDSVRGKLSHEQIEAVATYVSELAGPT